MRPEAGAGAGFQTGHLPDSRNVLAGESSAEDVHRWHRVPVDQSDVAKVRGIWPVAGEDACDRFVDLGEPDGAGVEDFLNGEIKPAVAGEQ
jgi:hypothetical protein